jgi:hypothetical protein
MKKMTMIAAIAALAFASCKKDRTCTCTTTPTSGTVSTYKVTYYDAAKKDARSLCTSHATQTDNLTPVATTGSKTTCELK